MNSDRWLHWRNLYTLTVIIGAFAHFCRYDTGSNIIPATVSGSTPPLGDNNTCEPALPLSPEDLRRLRASSFEMFNFSFAGYMHHAFPKDDLRPLSCRGRNSQGGMALTLLDSLDALLLVEDINSLRRAVDWVSTQALFDIDARVHVFEVTIRALGGLLSTHTLLDADPHIMPGYDGALLRAAVDLADRLMPAFDTPTGLPLAWINLRKGGVKGDTRVTCTACAGTMLLEFGVLSRLTGNDAYETKAKNAVKFIWEKRSVRNLVGNTINVDTGKWARRDAGTGAGVDSFYEYLLKAYLAFGDRSYLEMFSESYAAAQANMALVPSVNGVSFPVVVHMTSGRLLHPYVSSLSAFWPGMQALVGQISEATALHRDWMTAWERFKWTPEMFDVYMHQQHPSMVGYPLRPELIESTFLLYSATGNETLLRMASKIQDRIMNTTRGNCGFASIGDVRNGRLEDSMESFFLSETAKYFYLFFSNATTLIDHFVLSTEAHFMPILESLEEEEDLGAEEQQNRGVPHRDAAEEDKLEGKCTELCGSLDPAGYDAKAAALRTALPRLPFDASGAPRLRRRRCAACRAVTLATARATRQAKFLWSAGADSPKKAGQSNVAPPQWALSQLNAKLGPRQFLCTLSLLKNKKQLGCGSFHEVPTEDLNSQSVQALPHNYLFLQVSEPPLTPPVTHESIAPSLLEILVSTNASLSATAAEEPSIGIPGMLAQFGPDMVPGCSQSETDAAQEAAWEEYEREMNAKVDEQLELPDDEEEPDDKEETEEEIQRRIAETLARTEATTATDSKAGARSVSGSEKMQVVFSQQNRVDDEITIEKESVGVGGGEASHSSSIGVTEDCGASAAYEEESKYNAVCGVSGKLVIANPEDACSPLMNAGGKLQGALVIINRGGCSFQSKVAAAESAGAVAAIIINISENMLYRMVGDPQEDPPRIPGLMIRGKDSPVILGAAAEERTANVWSPSLPRKLKLSYETIDEEELDAANGQSGSHSGSEGLNEGQGTCAAKQEYAQELLVGRDSDETCSAEAGPDEVAQIVHVEMVIPPNSRVWVLQQIYQRKVDLNPVFEQISDVLKSATSTAL